MKPGTVVALALAGLSISTSTPPQQYSYVGKKCTSAGGLTVLVGGAEIGTVADSDFAVGSSCTVIPPATGVASSLALRCYVDGSNNARIVATTGVVLGVAQGAATWCVEVRTVDPAFVE